MPYLGSSPARGLVGSADIDADVITEAKMANDAIGLPELKAGTDGELITWDASGNPATVGAGTSGHFLKSQGAGSVPVFAAAAGGLTFLSAATASNDASIAFTSLIDSTYDDYMVTLTNVVPVTSGGRIQLALSQNNGSSYLSASYRYANSGGSDADSALNEGSASNSIMLLATLVDNTAGYGANGFIRIQGVASGAYTVVTSVLSHLRSTAFQTTTTAGTYFGDTNAIDAIRLNNNAGNLNTGTIRLYGITKA